RPSSRTIGRTCASRRWSRCVCGRIHRMPPVLVRDGVVRNDFLASLGTRTWRARAVGAAALADPAAVSSRGAYAAWLCRTTRAWSRLPMPWREGAPEWPLLSVGPECLDRHAALDADLADLCH